VVIRPSAGLKVAVVEPWFSGSHRSWAEGFAAHSSCEVSLVTHEGRFWRWRLAGGSLTLASELAGHVERHGTPDVVVVSAMVDIAALLGFCRSFLHDTPVVAYFHENQLTYRSDAAFRPPQAPAITNWLSAAVADEVWFNSSFHRDSFLGALEGFLEERPDNRHTFRLPEVMAKSHVQPVGVDFDWLDPLTRPGDLPLHPDGPLVVWNHRWDHDKNPKAFLDCLVGLAAEGVAFRVALLGENTRSDPQEFDRAITALGERVVHLGHLDLRSYRSVLGEADVVVSTAVQEFFGISVVEAVAAGAVPVLPNRLSYPGLIDDTFHRSVLYEDADFAQVLRSVLTDIGAARRAVTGIAELMQRYAWSRVAPGYDRRLHTLAST
jgi:glycosyltransferase involved in cell wall biosynthesis